MLLFYSKIGELSALLHRRLRREEGQAMIEYALILALISVVTIVVLRLIGVSVTGLFTTVNSALSAAQT
jgi:pilus assembly protein Flp/PilA